MITLNKTFAFERDQWCWNLYTTRPTVIGKGGKTPTTTTKTDITYHATIPQLARAIMEKCADTCESMEELTELFEKAEATIVPLITEKITTKPIPLE